LLIIALSFAIGVGAALLVVNASSATATTFSVPSLIAFIFGIAVSSASIVLAIAAIYLGRVSEESMAKRSDESIRLQNEIFLRTTDALARIESSTGTTEKRIEDIIAGRAGAISDRIAEDVLDARHAGGKNREDLEQEIRRSVEDELTQSPTEEETAERKKRAEERRQVEEVYDEFNMKVLLAISNIPGTRSLRIGEGRGTSGDTLFDGLFEVNGRKIGIATMSCHPRARAFNPRLRPLFDGLFDVISTEVVDRAFVVYDDKLKVDGSTSTAIKKLLSFVKEGIANSVFVFDGEWAEVQQEIRNTLQQISEAAEPGAGADAEDRATQT